MRILFARHGESQANTAHEISNRGLRHPLTPVGRAQALSLARNLQPWPITRIFSSPLLRAIETSIIVANQLGVEYEVVDALREYDVGNLEGRADAEAWRIWQDLFDSWTKDMRLERRIEGGESFYGIKDRFLPFIDNLIRQYRDTDANLLCVSHGGVYWMMLPVVLENVNTAFIREHKGFDYTSVVVAELSPTGLACTEWNGVRISSRGQDRRVPENEAR